MSFVAALTGNIASGKSTVAAELVERGAWLVDADLLARDAVAPGTPGLAAIVARWGTSVLQPDGALDRAALRRIVFASDEERAHLNAIVHPRVEALRRERVAAARDAGAPVVICDIPLLFESGRDRRGDFDAVILVTAPAAVRLARLVEYRGLAREEAERMMAAQLPEEAKRARADYVIENGGSREALRAQVDATWRSLLSRAATQPSRAAARPS
ncbi:MAG TPA: dephospho-CoA kinase [Gemmatimonadaceae bacterium]|nr:dephospho-CoA kinase [Gemmatimonadaceae bacterium]